jgi:SAM-dependent methyltransferase
LTNDAERLCRLQSGALAVNCTNSYDIPVRFIEGSRPLENGFYFVAGLAFLALAKVKHVLLGYTTPKTFSIREIDRCIEYDERLVDEWLALLRSYTGCDAYLSGKRVVELGPGSDLGIGYILIAKGAARYIAVDAHDNVSRTPEAFYDRLFFRLRERSGTIDLPGGFREGGRDLHRSDDRVCYRHQPDFNIVAALGSATVDLFFSQAAFEHFENIDHTVEQMTQVAAPGAIAVLIVDLRTHSRWIRDKDPNNIYRYPSWIYESFRFSGIPNRKRPFEYRRALEAAGWVDVRIRALSQLTSSHPSVERSRFSKQFHSPDAEMDTLTVLICARRPGANVRTGTV